jgi:hypothetical protein
LWKEWKDANIMRKKGVLQLALQLIVFIHYE